jgi:hypothetical protein
MKLPTALGSVLALTALACAAPAGATTFTYTTSLSGSIESPPNASPGAGLAIVTIDDSSFMMRVQTAFFDLTGTVTASHIHCCTTSPDTGTAGVATALPTFPGFPLGGTSGFYDHVFDMTDSASWNLAFVTAHGGTTSSAFAALAAGLGDGTAYLNIHTTAFTGGEIRGFLSTPAIPEPSTYALMLGGLAAVGLAARRRRT